MTKPPTKPKDDSLVLVGTRVTPEQREKLKALADKELGRPSVAFYLRRLIERDLTHQDGGGDTPPLRVIDGGRDAAA